MLVTRLWDAAYIHALLRAANSGYEVATQHSTVEGALNAGRTIEGPTGAA
jgi:hypothetical protein